MCGSLCLLTLVGCSEGVVDEVLARADTVARESSKARLAELETIEGDEPDLQNRVIVAGSKPAK